MRCKRILTFDLDQLLSQHNYREIYNDKMRFIAAAAMYPDRQEQLRKVLEQMEVIETVMIQAQEVAKRGDYAGAWEAVALSKIMDSANRNNTMPPAIWNASISTCIASSRYWPK